MADIPRSNEGQSLEYGPLSSANRQGCGLTGFWSSWISILVASLGWPASRPRRRHHPLPNVQPRPSRPPLHAESGRRRRAGALASVRHSNCTDGFPVCSFHEDTFDGDAMKSNHRVGPPPARQVDPGHQYHRTMMYGFFAKRTDPPHRPYSPAARLVPPAFARRLPRPTPVADHSVMRISPRFRYYSAVRLLNRASLPTSLPLIGLLTPVFFSRDPVSPPGVTRCSSVPCRPQSPWCGG